MATKLNPGLGFNQDARNDVLQRMMGLKLFDLFAGLVAKTSQQISDTQYLNSYNSCGNRLPENSDVVVVGGGIHALIYAIHARSLEIQNGSKSNPLLFHLHAQDI